MLRYLFGLSGGMVGLVGLAILWANPRRTVNLAVSVNALLMALWAFLTHFGINSTHGENVAWLRAQGAVGGFLPFSLLLVSDAIMGRPTIGSAAWFGRRWPIILITAVLVVLPLSSAYMPYASSHTLLRREWGHLTFLLLGVATMLLLFSDTLHKISSLRDTSRHEMQTWILSGCICYLIQFLLVFLKEYSSVVVPAYISLAIAIATLAMAAAFGLLVAYHKVFDARYLLLALTKHLVFFATLAGGIYGVLRLSRHYDLEVWVLCGAIAVIAWSGTWWKRLLDIAFTPAKSKQARQTILTLARSAVQREALISGVLDIWRGWAEVERVFLIDIAGTSHGTGDSPLAISETLLSTVRELQWVTPERLHRERTSRNRQQVGEWLEREQLGLVVVSEGPSLCVVAALGMKPTRKPYAFDQVELLQDMTGAITAAMERFAAMEKAASAERLATIGLMGASVAHEIRNPILAIKTFAQLLPDHYNDPEFRQQFFGMVHGEAARINELTEHLLDLSAPPRAAESIDLHPSVEACVEMLHPLAQSRQARWIKELGANPSIVWANNSLIKQVVLNLLMNSLQALEDKTANGWVKISTRNVSRGVELRLEDNGPGIARDAWPRLFEPFQTTKSRGFGLGLSTSRDLLVRIGGSIQAEAPQVGRGAVFKIIFPTTGLESPGIAQGITGARWPSAPGVPPPILLPQSDS